MNESTIDILAAILNIVLIALTGVLAGWVWGYGAGYRKATRESQNLIWHLDYSSGLLPGEANCTQCGATMPEHYYGCPIAAEFKLVTIVKPGG